VNNISEQAVSSIDRVEVIEAGSSDKLITTFETTCLITQKTIILLFTAMKNLKFPQISSNFI
jgi:hypothetical protein